MSVVRATRQAEAEFFTAIPVLKTDFLKSKGGARNEWHALCLGQIHYV